MRKRMIQQKMEGVQLNLFDSQVVSFRPRNASDGGTIKIRNGELEFLSLLSGNRTLTVTLLGKIVSLANLNRACKSVRQNGGAAGVDGMEVEELGDWLGNKHQWFSEEVLSERYQPNPIRGVSIPKPDGGTRILGIPCVVDRMLQQAIHDQLNIYYDPLFSERSYGYRPGRGALDAIRQASFYIKSGSEWVVDIDLKSFFDEINHDRLMQRLSKGIGDKRLLRLIRRYLRVGMMKEGLTSQRISGTPQGGLCKALHKPPYAK